MLGNYENIQKEMSEFKEYPLDTRYKVGRDGTIIGAKGKIMKPSTDPAGRRHVMVGNKLNQAVHIMVALAWIPNPNNFPEINHINGICDDNRADNLEWCTKEHNMRHASQMGLMKRGSNHYLSKLDEIQVRTIKKCLTDGLSCKQIGQYFKVNRKTIDSIRVSKSWAWI